MHIARPSYPVFLVGCFAFTVLENVPCARMRAQGGRQMRRERKRERERERGGARERESERERRERERERNTVT